MNCLSVRCQSVCNLVGELRQAWQHAFQVIFRVAQRMPLSCLARERVCWPAWPGNSQPAASVAHRARPRPPRATAPSLSSCSLATPSRSESEQRIRRGRGPQPAQRCGCDAAEIPGSGRGPPCPPPPTHPPGSAGLASRIRFVCGRPFFWAERRSRAFVRGGQIRPRLSGGPFRLLAPAGLSLTKCLQQWRLGNLKYQPNRA